MLKKIGLKNFKRFREMSIMPVNQINLLTGINGCGKSTILQALLLMRQSPEHSRTTHQIIFNGSCVELGTFDDVRNSLVSRNEPIELLFGFASDDHQLDLHYTLHENMRDDKDEGVSDDMVADITRLVGKKPAADPADDSQVLFEFARHQDGYKLTVNTLGVPTTWYNLLFAPTTPVPDLCFVFDLVNFTKIHYIAADRIGPRELYSKQSFTEFPNVGRQGEFIANILYKKKNDPVGEYLRIVSAETNTVADHAQEWLRLIFDGGKLDVNPLEANALLLKMNSDDTLNFYKPINVGFGYSYALPIIVSGLVAQPGDILIVENPEAHLHPYAQSQIAQFLARVSASGIQVFIESHSDHILNALRIAVLEQIIRPEHLNILYFSKKQDQSVITIPVNPDGSIEHWPDGFFDQTNKDFSRLFRM